MTPVLVDSSVILDVLTEDPVWGVWSSETLTRCADEAELVVNPLIYAEISVSFQRIEELEAVLTVDWFRREDLPWEAAFLAGKSFLAYRRRGGARRSPLPDFYIGAHAAIRQYRLATRDSARFATYYPSVELIAPERDSPGAS